MVKNKQIMNLLSIGGSDPSSGAGIQSDIKAFSEFNANSLTVITAITSQNTSSFGIVEPVSEKILKEQLESVMTDFRIDGIKIGMVHNSKIIKSIYNELKDLKIPIVIDPVIKSTTGGMLINKSDIEDFRKILIPLATIITPNEFEAEKLSKLKMGIKNNPEKIAMTIQNMGAKNVVITGIESNDNQILDFVQEKNKNYSIIGNKISKINHGSGCNYSAALTFALANKNNIKKSVQFAKKITYKSILNSKKIGKGIAITSIQNKDKINTELSRAINKFVEIKNIYKNIPECQTNFVYSKNQPKTTKEVLGIEGRIVKVGNHIEVAGDLSYGGSKHVATAVIAVNSKFSYINSAINLKYQKSMITKIKKTKLKVLEYDRDKEPVKIKSHGSTMKWGIKEAIKNSTKAPDVIFHKGDWGKEPMIIIFAENPENIIKKIKKII